MHSDTTQAFGRRTLLAAGLVILLAACSGSSTTEPSTANVDDTGERTPSAATESAGEAAETATETAGDGASPTAETVETASEVEPAGLSQPITEIVVELAEEEAPTHTQMSLDGSAFAVATRGLTPGPITLSVYDTATGALTWSAVVPEAQEVFEMYWWSGALSLAMDTPDGRVLVTVDPETGTITDTKPYVACGGTSFDNFDVDRGVVYLFGSNVCPLDLGSGEQSEIAVDNEGSGPSAVALNADATRFILTETDYDTNESSYSVYDTTTFQPTGETIVPSVGDGAIFGYGTDTLMVGSRDPESPAVLSPSGVGLSGVVQWAVSARGGITVTSERVQPNEAAQFWVQDLIDGSEKATFLAGTFRTTLSVASDGSHVLVSQEDGSVRIFAL